MAVGEEQANHDKDRETCDPQTLNRYVIDLSSKPVL